MSSTGEFMLVGKGLKKYIGPGGDVVIPESVTGIENYAFAGYKNLDSVTIPNSVKWIEKLAFGKSAQVDMSKTRILIDDFSLLPPSLRPNAVVGFAVNGGGKDSTGFEAYSKYAKTNAAKLVDTAMAEPILLAMMCREHLITKKNVELYIEAAQKTGNTEVIAMMLDYQANVISAKQKEQVEKQKEKEQDTIIDRMAARSGKDGIEGLNIAVTGKLETFVNRDGLKAFITEKGGRLVSSLTSRVDYLIMNDPESDSIKAKTAQELGIEIIDERNFNLLSGRAFILVGTELVQYYGPGGDVVIPDGVTDLYACFQGCTDITSVAIPDSVTNIGDYAFWGCTSLIRVSIPKNVTSIGYGAFAKCPNLTIYTSAGSYAEKYVKKKKIPFVAE